MDERSDEPRTVDGNEAGRVLVYNPASGAGDHANEILTRAAERGLAVRETEGSGDARRFARAAADEGVSTVAVAGGDGTINEVVHGLSEADAFRTVDVAVFPTGTANLVTQALGMFDGDGSAVTHLRTATLSIEGLDDERVRVTLDGESHVAATHEIGIRERCLTLYAEPSEVRADH